LPTQKRLEREIPRRRKYGEERRGRMGSGKGEPDHYVAVAKPGRIVFEVSGMDVLTATHVLIHAGQEFRCEMEVVERSVESL